VRRPRRPAGAAAQQRRRRAQALSADIGPEQHLPSRHLDGLLPAALLEQCTMWQAQSTGLIVGSLRYAGGVADRAARQAAAVLVRIETLSHILFWRPVDAAARRDV
jgi:hypothetical protein